MSVQLMEREQVFLDRLQQDPKFFVEECLGDKPYDKQIEILEAIRDHDFVSVRSCNGAGKDFIMSRASLWLLFRRPCIVITSAPTNRQVEQVIWGEIRQAYQKGNAMCGFPGQCLTRKIEIGPKWYALGFSTDEESQFQGFHGEEIMIVFSEAQGMAAQMYNAARRCLTSNAKFVLIGNPLATSVDYMETFKNANWKNVHISAFDTPNFKTFGITIDDIRNNTWKDKVAGRPMPYPALVQPKWVRMQYEELGEDDPFWKASVLGEFPQEGSDDSLIPIAWILAAVDRKIDMRGDHVLGIDVARYGTCETVGCDFDGYTCKFPIIKRNNSVTETAGVAIDYTREQSAMARENSHFRNWRFFIDDVGVGGGLTDVLEDQGYEVTGLIANSKANDAEKFYDLRSEMYWLVREAFRMNTISIPNDKKLIAQLAGQKFEHNARGQKRLFSKEKMIKGGAESPDRADAMAIAVWGWKKGVREAPTSVGLNTRKMMAGGAGGW